MTDKFIPLPDGLYEVAVRYDDGDETTWTVAVGGSRRGAYWKSGNDKALDDTIAYYAQDGIQLGYYKVDGVTLLEVLDTELPEGV